MAARRVGIFGGVFNPIHLGHIALAKKAMSALNLDKLYIVPCSDPSHKAVPAVNAMTRFRMAEIAFRDIANVYVSPMEIERKGTSYTIDTLREVIAQEGGVRPIIIIGADNIREIKTWRSPGLIFKEADIVAFTRPGFDYRNSAEVECGKIVFIEMEPQPYSSTEIRSRLSGNQSIKAMVPEGVESYIRENNLYR